jgi:hypothetical protein
MREPEPARPRDDHHTNIRPTNHRRRTHMAKPISTEPITAVAHISIIGFDPFVVLQAVHHPAAAGSRQESVLVRHLRQMQPAERGLFGGLAVHCLARHMQPGDPRQQISYIAARFIETLGAMHCRTARGGFGHFLEPYFEPDDQRRRTWLALALKLQELGPDLTVDLIRNLVDAGDLRSTLKRRRDEIDGVLAVLDAMPTSAA